jgi:3-amino-5-hydroxybenzoate synthase
MEKLAILGGEPVKKTPFPAWPQYDEREEQALKEVLESRVWWRTPGTKTCSSSDFAAYHGGNTASPSPTAPPPWKL